MAKNNSVGKIIGIIVLLIVCVYGLAFLLQGLLYGNASETVPEEIIIKTTTTTLLPVGDGSSLAECMTARGAKMYGSESCGYCKKQKSEFGSDFQYINYINCGVDRAACSAAGIRGYPTWEINGQLSPGYKSLGQLAELSGCTV